MPPSLLLLAGVIAKHQKNLYFCGSVKTELFRLWIAELFLPVVGVMKTNLNRYVGFSDRKC